MKKMKKIFSVLLAFAFVIAMMIPTSVKAAENYALTINGDANHTYKIYQLATADISGAEAPYTVANIAVGKNAKSTTTVEQIKALSGKTDAEEIGSGATALVNFESAAFETVSFDKKEAKAVNVPGGYYVIVDTASDGSVISRNMVAVAGPTAVTPKKTEVTSEKVIDAKENGTIDKDAEGNLNKPADAEGNETTDKTYNSANIGDKVPYVVETKVPDMTGYTKYYFVMQDKLSKGLTYNGDMKVTIGGTELTADKYEVLTSEDDDGNTIIKVAIKDFISYKNQKDAKIDFVYSATLNDNAVVGNTGNDNDARIIYSNNPNVTPEGEPDHPDFPKENWDTVDGIGQTQWDNTKTYTTGVELIKVDATSKKVLEGAEFKIEGTGTKTTHYNVYTDSFVVDEKGTFYKLKDGTYTEEAPTDDREDEETGDITHGTKDLYESTTTMYKKVVTKTTSTTTEETKISATATTGADGIIRFEGLDEGTYTITEMKAPTGYNLLANPITVKITFNGTADVKWSGKVDGENATMNTNGLIELTVDNNKGGTLPSTGGIGTTIFYVIGGILMVGAAVVLVSKKRMA